MNRRMWIKGLLGITGCAVVPYEPKRIYSFPTTLFTPSVQLVLADGSRMRVYYNEAREAFYTDVWAPMQISRIESARREGPVCTTFRREVNMNLLPGDSLAVACTTDGKPWPLHEVVDPV